MHSGSTGIRHCCILQASLVMLFHTRFSYMSFFNSGETGSQRMILWFMIYTYLKDYIDAFHPRKFETRSEDVITRIVHIPTSPDSFEFFGSTYSEYEHISYDISVLHIFMHTSEPGGSGTFVHASVDSTNFYYELNEKSATSWYIKLSCFLGVLYLGHSST